MLPRSTKIVSLVLGWIHTGKFQISIAALTLFPSVYFAGVLPESRRHKQEHDANSRPRHSRWQPREPVCRRDEPDRSHQEAHLLPHCQEKVRIRGEVGEKSVAAKKKASWGRGHRLQFRA